MTIRLLTIEQIAERTRILLAIVKDIEVRNEKGDLITSFANEGSDAADFVNVSRTDLHMLMIMAHEAGMKVK